MATGDLRARRSHSAAHAFSAFVYSLSDSVR